MTKLIRKTVNDTITQFLIDNGKLAVDLAQSADVLTLCKNALNFIEERNCENFIKEVLNGIKEVDTESLNAVKSLNRFYATIQVVKKATTNDKIIKFKKMIVNGICHQDEITDSEYELYLNIIDDLTDIEFLILYKINQIEKEHSQETFDNLVSKKVGTELLFDLNMTSEIFSSYIARLKAKGLIVSVHGHWMSMNEQFFIGIVDGKISELYKKLIEFIELKNYT